MPAIPIRGRGSAIGSAQRWVSPHDRTSSDRPARAIPRLTRRGLALGERLCGVEMLLERGDGRPRKVVDVAARIMGRRLVILEGFLMVIGHAAQELAVERVPGELRQLV